MKPARLLSFRHPIRILAGLLVFAAALAIVHLRSARNALLQQSRALKLELAAAGLEKNQPPAHARGDARALSEDQLRELLRLRAEANRLLAQQHELTRLAGENRQMRAGLLADVLEFGGHELTRQEVEEYLARHGRSGQSLLTASRITDDTELLQEALLAAPNDPEILLAAALERAWTGQRRQRLDALMQAAPHNALARYLSAHDCFESGQPARALQELATANAQPSFEDFSAQSFRRAEELFLGLGYSEAAAKAAAWNFREHSVLNSLAELERSLRKLAQSYRESGDEMSGETVLTMGVQLGQRLAEEPVEFKTLDREGLGIVIQKRMLQAMKPAEPEAGGIVSERLEKLARRREDIVSSEDPTGWDGYRLKLLSEPQIIDYFDRLTKFGELEARRWAISQQAD